MDNTTAKPKCPDHPLAGVLPARKPTETNLQWLCLECGAKLGDAGEADFGWEQQTIGDRKSDKPATLREERATKLGWKKVPSEDDPAGWCWLLPHGSTRASTTDVLNWPVEGEVENQPNAGVTYLG